jgi:hypothetical protein
MGKAKAVIHIGTHKTATTSIQTMIAERPDHFPGLYYPMTGRVGCGQHNVAWELCGMGEFRPELGTLDELIAEVRSSGARKVLLSSEDFSNIWDPAQLSRLRTAFESTGFETDVVVVLRDRYSRVESHFREALRHGETRDFDTFVDVTTQPDIRYVLDYADLLRRFADVFGADRIHPLEYDPDTIVERFFQLAGQLLDLPLTKVDDWPRHNEREPEFRRDPGKRLNEAQRAVISQAFGDVVVPPGYATFEPPERSRGSRRRWLTKWLS